MAARVAQALAEGRIALVEAGTGTGKSLAYLLPLARHVAEEGAQARAVIATYTIHLQEQLVARDLPLVERVLGRPVRSAVAKGWGNYLCRLRLHRLLQGRGLWLEAPEGAEPLSSHLHVLARWADATEEGSLSELPPEAGMESWSLVAADPERCTRRRCPFYEGCFYFRARQRVFEAQLVVANHHLLLADLVLRREAAGADAAVLPPYRYLVVDEAHHLDEVATAHLGMEASRSALVGRLERLARGRAPGELEQAALEALAAVREVFDHLARAMAAEPAAAEGEGSRTLRLRPGDGERLVPDPVPARAVQALDRLARAAHCAAETLEQALPGDEGGEAEQRVAELRALGRWAQQSGEQILTLLEAADEDYVFWVEAGPRHELALKAAPLEVGPVLAGELLAGVRAAILTSATMACGGRFDALRRRLGLPPPEAVPGAGPGEERQAFETEPTEASPDEDGVVRVTVGSGAEPQVVRGDGRVVECVVPSPFDFRRQAVVAVPWDFPDVDSPDFPPRLAGLVDALASALEGRTFVLFTSYRALAEARRLLEVRLSGKGIGLLCQGDRPRSRLLDAFRAADGLGWVLLGTDSFWEGVDVPGAALSCVVLARLPFAVPDHPVALARAERLRRQGLNPFREEALPRAVLKFRQGFGRLVRTRCDRGAVVVADRRILTRSYRASFLDALPRCQLLAGPAERIVREVAAWTAPPSPSRYS